jgi:hypothetical protein
MRLNAWNFKKMLGEYVTDLDVVMELGYTEAIKKQCRMAMPLTAFQTTPTAVKSIEWN